MTLCSSPALALADLEETNSKSRVSHTRRWVVNGLRGLSRTFTSTCHAQRSLIINDTTVVPILPDVEIMPDLWLVPTRAKKPSLTPSNSVPPELEQTALPNEGTTDALALVCHYSVMYRRRSLVGTSLLFDSCCCSSDRADGG